MCLGSVEPNVDCLSGGMMASVVCEASLYRQRQEG